MTNEQFLSYLKGKEETQRVEFKSACIWDEKTFAKDILAMSNVQNGGYIIIGVDDSTFKPTGINSEIKNSYNIDIMKDQMTKYADPHVDFSIMTFQDESGKEYIVIKINQFEEIPVICRRDNPSAQVTKGKIYYRNRDRRVESASVSNSYDMRNIIELAIIRMFNRKKELGYNIKFSDEEKFEKEFNEINNIKDPILLDLINNNIKKYGHWEITFQPNIFRPILESVEECKNLVRNNYVDIIGWDFPHFPTHSEKIQDIQNGNDCCQAWTNYGQYKEFWKLYKSGHFIIYIALREDWYKEDIRKNDFLMRIEPNKYIGVRYTILAKAYEIFEFLSRLCKNGLYNEGVNIKIRLNNIENRELWFEKNPSNFSMQDNRTSAPYREYQKELTKDKIIINSIENSIDFALYILDCFGWYPPRELIRKYIEEIINGN